MLRTRDDGLDEVVLTTQMKINVLSRALELLGKKGENWIRHDWWGRKKGTYVERDCEAAEATCWCVNGAMEQAAFELGYSPVRRTSFRMEIATSLHSLAVRKFPICGGAYGVNDAYEFPVIRDLVKERIEELESHTTYDEEEASVAD